eukprot:m.89905 g.89905  ORF g.89905 m.89905 type:complete len:462 (-) comp8841_c5_seq1:371-1756(-)
MLSAVNTSYCEEGGRGGGTTYSNYNSDNCLDCETFYTKHTHNNNCVFAYTFSALQFQSPLQATPSTPTRSSTPTPTPTFQSSPSPDASKQRRGKGKLSDLIRIFERGNTKNMARSSRSKSLPNDSSAITTAASSTSKRSFRRIFSSLKRSGKESRKNTEAKAEDECMLMVPTNDRLSKSATTSSSPLSSNLPSSITNRRQGYRNQNGKPECSESIGLIRLARPPSSRKNNSNEGSRLSIVAPPLRNLHSSDNLSKVHSVRAIFEHPQQQQQQQQAYQLFANNHGQPLPPVSTMRNNSQPEAPITYRANNSDGTFRATRLSATFATSPISRDLFLERRASYEKLIDSMDTTPITSPQRPSEARLFEGESSYSRHGAKWMGLFGSLKKKCSDSRMAFMAQKFDLVTLQQSSSLHLEKIGVDLTHKERHLHDTEFIRVLGCTPSEFASLPIWRQQQKKKLVSLF